MFSFGNFVFRSDRAPGHKEFCMNDEPIFTDRSQMHKTYMYLYGIVGFCLAGYLFMAVRYIMNTGRIPWLDLVTLTIVSLFIIGVSSGRSTYEIYDDCLVVTYSSLFRVRKLRIPFDVIDGSFHFKVEPIKTLAYKKTYRMYGSLDKRNIWSLVYNIPGTDKVSRILMKASDEFWDALEKKLPGRIRIPQEDVLKHAYYHISGAEANGIGPDGKPLKPAEADADIDEETDEYDDYDDEDIEDADDIEDEDVTDEETEEMSLADLRKKIEKE